VNEGASTPPVVVQAEGDHDLMGMIEVRSAADPAAPPPRLDNLRHNLASNARLSYFVARVGQTALGCGFVDTSAGVAARAHTLVVPTARNEGIGSALLAALSKRARNAGHIFLEGPIRATDEVSLGYFARRGYTKVGGEQALTLELATVQGPPGAPPSGVRVVSRAESPGVVDGMYAVACEAEPDIPGGSSVRPFDAWKATEIDRPSLEPGLTFVALAGGEVVGYAILDTLRGEPWHRLTAVKRVWRGRGVATALKIAQINAARERGFERLVTTNEERNAPMRRINERLGYTPEPTLSTTVVRGPLRS